jgi:hypothetical protein
VAEKSFLRRQIALAQAAVSRMHQLSSRIAQILDQRPRTTQLWKPAIPLVAGFALLCGLSLRQAPVLVSFADAKPSGSTATAVHLVDTTPAASASLVSSDRRPAAAQGMGVRLVNAGFKSEGERQHSLPATAVKHRPESYRAIEQAQSAHPATMRLASYSGYVVEHEEFIVTMTSQGMQPGQWKVQVWQMRVLVPASQTTEKPTPRKT